MADALGGDHILQLRRAAIEHSMAKATGRLRPDGHPWDDLLVVGRLDVEAAFEDAGYRIEAVIGRGGVGTVYRAVQTTLQRDVALKLLKPHQAGDEAFRERFLEESILTASLDHPHIVPVYDAGEVAGVLY